MRKIYILLHKDSDDYRSLPDGETVFIYKYFPKDIRMDDIWNRVQKLLSESDPENDLIVFNGPSVLCGVAGSIWFADDRRTKFGVLAFNNKLQRYEEHQEQIP